MYAPLYNCRTEKVDTVDTRRLNDENVQDYLPQCENPYSPQNAAIRAMYRSYRRLGATPYQAIFGVAMTTVFHKPVPAALWPVDKPTVYVNHQFALN